MCVDIIGGGNELEINQSYSILTLFIYVVEGY